MKNFNGKCSRCDVMKADFEEVPTPYDILLCDLCFNQVTKNALRDNAILLLLEDLDKMKDQLKAMLT